MKRPSPPPRRDVVATGRGSQPMPDMFLFGSGTSRAYGFGDGNTITQLPPPSRTRGCFESPPEPLLSAREYAERHIFQSKRFPIFRQFKSAQYAGKGAYGLVLGLRMDSRARAGLRGLLSGLCSTVILRAPDKIPDGTWVALKIVQYKGSKMFPQGFVRRAGEEARVHAYISSRRAKVHGAMVSGKQISPEFYFGGMDGARGVYVHCMEFLEEETTLSSYVRRHGVTARLYAAVERAVETLNALGIAHSDLHHNNVLVRPIYRRPILPQTKTAAPTAPIAYKVFLLDFGKAVALPKSAASLMREVTASPNTTLDKRRYELAWNKTILPFLNVEKASNEWYNPEVKLLRVLFHKMSAAQAAKVEIERSKLYTTLRPHPLVRASTSTRPNSSLGSFSAVARPPRFPSSASPRPSTPKPSAPRPSARSSSRSKKKTALTSFQLTGVSF